MLSCVDLPCTRSKMIDDYSRQLIARLYVVIKCSADHRPAHGKQHGSLMEGCLSNFCAVGKYGTNVYFTCKFEFFMSY